MNRIWLLRWRWSDGDESTRTQEATFTDYRMAQIKIGRIIESPRPLEWITGPTEVFQ